jgi:hypothetical protein
MVLPFRYPGFSKEFHRLKNCRKGESQIHTKLDAFESHMNDNWVKFYSFYRSQTLHLIQVQTMTALLLHLLDLSDPKPPSFAIAILVTPLKYPLMRLSLILLPSAVFRSFP